jgi:hypothetical protein
VRRIPRTEGGCGASIARVLCLHGPCGGVSLKSCQQRFQQSPRHATQRGSGAACFTVGWERQRATLHQHNIDWLNNVMMAHVSVRRDGFLASSCCDACARKHHWMHADRHPRDLRNVSKTPQRFSQAARVNHSHPPKTTMTMSRTCLAATIIVAVLSSSGAGMPHPWPPSLFSHGCSHMCRSKCSCLL